MTLNHSKFISVSVFYRDNLRQQTQKTTYIHRVTGKKYKNKHKRQHIYRELREKQYKNKDKRQQIYRELREKQYKNKVCI